MSKKLAIITTHPIQYYAPVFKLLAQSMALKVFYTGGEQLHNQFDYGFNKQIIWDISLLDGYPYKFLNNTAKIPGSHHFNGIINPDAIHDIKAYQPDVILVYGWSYKSHLKLLRHFKGKIPILFRGDSTLLDEINGFLKIVKKIVLRWIYKHIDVALYVGQNNKAYFKVYGLKDNQLIFAPHAIDNNRFAEKRTEEAHKLRETLEIDPDEILILFAGKLTAKKNPQLLLQAFIELDLPNTQLLIVGNGELEESLKSKVQNLTSNKPNKKRIHFIDFQNQTKMPIIYQACDLFCLPSQGPGETWGLAVNEAMAAGKAVLLSHKVGCAKDLINEQNGRIFKSNDLSDLKEKLIALTKSKSLLIDMGINASNKIKNWSYENQANAIVEYVKR